MNSINQQQYIPKKQEGKKQVSGTRRTTELKAGVSRRTDHPRSSSSTSPSASIQPPSILPLCLQSSIMFKPTSPLLGGLLWYVVFCPHFSSASNPIPQPNNPIFPFPIQKLTPRQTGKPPGESRSRKKRGNASVSAPWIASSIPSARHLRGTE